jgi:hypothetical protein
MKSTVLFGALLLIFIGCRSQTSVASLFCVIPSGISFPDSSKVMLKGQQVGYIKIITKSDSAVKVHILFAHKIHVPIGSYLTFKNNVLSNGAFQLAITDSISCYGDDATLPFQFQSTERHADPQLKDTPDLKEIHAPVMIQKGKG